MPDGSNLNILFGQRVRLLREKCGKTQAQLAERIGVTEQYIGMIERGRSSPSFAVIQKLCQALAAKPAHLFLHQPEEARPDPAEVQGDRQPLGVAYWEKDLVTGKIFLSRALYRMFGLSNGATENWDMEQFLARVHPEDRELVRRYEPRLLAGNGPLCLRFRYFSGSAGNAAPETRMAQCWIYLETGVRGEPLTVCGTVCDVTGSPEPLPDEKDQA
jgi:transcriptional regulator with XRE-family HTH domain